MRIGIIADIHGNFIALETVLADLARDPPDRIVCLGDVAATGPQPRETIARLRTLGCPVVMGNADDAFLHPIPDAGTNDIVHQIREIDRWCAMQVSPNDVDYLSTFRPSFEIALEDDRTLLCFHGSPRSFDDLISAATPEDELTHLLSGHRAALMAGGHTHAQMVRRCGDATIVNPGSVGLAPPIAAYAVIEATDGRLEIALRRLPLDSAAVRRAALISGMPHAEWWASFWG